MENDIKKHTADSVPGIRQLDEASASEGLNSTSRESLPNSCERCGKIMEDAPTRKNGDICSKVQLTSPTPDVLEKVAEAIFNHEQSGLFPPTLSNMALYGQEKVTWEFVNQEQFVSTVSDIYRRKAQAAIAAYEEACQNEGDDIESLKHDIDRYAEISSEMATENVQMLADIMKAREALTKCQTYFPRDAEITEALLSLSKYTSVGV